MRLFGVAVAIAIGVGFLFDWKTDPIAIAPVAPSGLDLKPTRRRN
jgi:hypothetical protein